MKSDFSLIVLGIIIFITSGAVFTLYGHWYWILFSLFGLLMTGMEIALREKQEEVENLNIVKEEKALGINSRDTTSNV